MLLETTAQDHLVPYRLVTSPAVGIGWDASSSVGPALIGAMGSVTASDLAEVGEHLQDLGANKCKISQLVWKCTIRLETQH